MDNVVLITGASTGIGLETAKLFQTKNWRVAATMRSPTDSLDLQNIADIECFRLDVTDIGSIRSAISETLDRFGRIDAIVNNAGYGAIGAFEAAEPTEIEAQFQTNVFGLMNVCREILPYYREQKRGIIINVASVGGRVGFPAFSLYNSSKWAVEGFSESLRYELQPFGIKVKLIEPGPIKTDFYSRSQTVLKKEGLHVYDNFVDRSVDGMNRTGESAPDGSIVADAIYRAATDDSWKLRYGVNTKGLLILRKLLPDSLFLPLVKKAIMR